MGRGILRLGAPALFHALRVNLALRWTSFNTVGLLADTVYAPVGRTTRAIRLCGAASSASDATAIDYARIIGRAIYVVRRRTAVEKKRLTFSAEACAIRSLAAVAIPVAVAIYFARDALA